jgi:hypothetical protein
MNEDIPMLTTFKDLVEFISPTLMSQSIPLSDLTRTKDGYSVGGVSIDEETVTADDETFYISWDVYRSVQTLYELMNE